LEESFGVLQSLHFCVQLMEAYVGKDSSAFSGRQVNVNFVIGIGPLCITLTNKNTYLSDTTSFSPFSVVLLRFCSPSELSTADARSVVSDMWRVLAQAVRVTILLYVLTLTKNEALLEEVRHGVGPYYGFLF
jgi:hypothetical protein